MRKYILGIQVSKCDKETERLCLFKRQYKECSKAIARCPYPLMVNPLCTCDNYNECGDKYHIVNKDDKSYILYYCQGCRYLIKDFDGAIEKIVKPLHSDKIWYGKDLDKLCKKILTADTKQKTSMQETIDYMERTLSSMNRRV